MGIHINHLLQSTVHFQVWGQEPQMDGLLFQQVRTLEQVQTVGFCAIVQNGQV